MSSAENPVYIVDGLRTPFLKATGIPSTLTASDLAVAVGRALLLRQPFEITDVDEVILGCVMSEATEANIARVVTLRLGGIAVPAWTVARNCASGLQALDCAWQKITSGESHLVLAGGTEAMSRMPILWRPELIQWWGKMTRAQHWREKMRALMQFRLRSLKPTIGLLKGLIDPVIGLSMGQTAEFLATKYQVTREQMDAYAFRSHQLASLGYSDGHFDNVLPIVDGDGRLITQDTGIRKNSAMDKLAALKPAFEPPFGRVTAGNSSLVADGACLLILASQAAIEKYDLPVLGRIHRTAWAALEPIEMGIGPVEAMSRVLVQHALAWDQIDYVEINEAFAAQVLSCCQVLANQESGLSITDKLNVYGGSIAIGHPVGASGARLVLDMLDILHRKKALRGIISLCIGGGQGGAVLVER